MMNKIILTATIALFLTACQDDNVHVTFHDVDTAKVEEPTISISDNNDGGAIPGLDAKVIDYHLPNEYQNKPQEGREGIVIMSWTSAGFRDAQDFIKFLKKFQYDVIDGDKNKIANYIKFPTPQIKTKKEFLANFEAIFRDDFKEEILQQNPSEIFRDKRGAMIGKDGQVWFKPVGGTYKIVSINF